MRQSCITHSKLSPQVFFNSKSMNVNTLLEIHSLDKTHCNAKKRKSNHIAAEEGFFWLLVPKDGSVSFSMKSFDEGNGK